MPLDMRAFISIGFLLIWSAAGSAQTVSGSLKGAVVDPEGAVMPGVKLTLTEKGTGTTLTGTTNSVGLFTFPALLAGTYDLSAEAAGFSRHRRTGIVITANDVRDLGTVTLALGEVVQSVTVADTATAVQTASGDKSGVITGSQLNEIALKGRDFLGFMSLLPGVTDTAASRDATSPNATQNIFINGARSDMKNFTVDGQLSVDVGSNNSMHFQPNMDTIAEAKVLTSSYQAEYGRSAGGLISVITRSGTQEFHGTGWWTHRHEQFNANNFFRNRLGLSKTPYRIDVAGFSAGGPIYVPRHFNTAKNKLFFFASQEYTRQSNDFGIRLKNMPTTAERNGDFSRSFDANGALIPVRDPSSRAPFPGNIIPANRINALGQSMLKFFPLPNYTDPDPRLVHRQNYQASASGPHPRRNDMVRIDVYPTARLNGYFRWIRDTDDSDEPYWGFDYLHQTTKHPNPGKGYVARATYTIGPTLFNEFTFGKSWNAWLYSPTEPDKIKRSVIGNIPQWFPNEAKEPTEVTDAQLIPNMNFGSIPVNSPAVTINNMQHINHNDNWDVIDNFTVIARSHTIKTGVYLSLTDKEHAQGNTWNGVFNFASNRNNPYDSGHGFANALLGNFQTYSESTRGIHPHGKYHNLEFYAQDNWRVSRRLTLDIGLRFYNMPPQSDHNRTLTVFVPGLYDPKKAPVLYRPAIVGGTRAAVNPLTGAAESVTLIGKYVPGSGDMANGMRVAGVDGFPGGGFTSPRLSAAPRFGFALDLSGSGRTVLRGGFGTYFDRARQLVASATLRNPPVMYAPTLFYGNLDTFASASGAIGPTTVSCVSPGHAKHPAVMTYSLGVQQRVPGSAVLDVSYVGTLSRHLLQGRNINPIPMFGRFDRANLDPTVSNSPLPDDFFRPFAGAADITLIEFASSSNYHSMQASLNRRFSGGLGLGVSYTFSKALGVADAWNDGVSPYFSPRQRDYGPLPFDRSHVFALNYIFDLPDLGRRLRNKVIGAVLDDWTVSGMTRFMSGAPFTPGYALAVATDTTGSSEGARITVIGDPTLPKSEKTFYRNFRTEAFAMTPVGSFGNAGVGVLRGPGMNNWDISLKKQVPIGLGEGRQLEFRSEFYNAFNHTQFSSLDTQGRFDARGNLVNPSFGSFTGALDPRVLSFALRLRF